MTRIATWNVNSVKARLDNVLDWLKAESPDILLLQEIKCEAAAFPLLEVKALGYEAALLGQKTYNGVAILARGPITNITEGLPGDDGDAQARWVEADVAGLRVASLYLPNGNPFPGEKFDYKLGWMERLIAHAKGLLALERPVVLGGDFNIIPEPLDCWDPAEWLDDALFQPQSRAAFRTLRWQGWTDAFRALEPRGGQYTYWDYQKGRWNRDEGIRIDHFLLSPHAADKLVACRIDRAARAREKASDHTPLVVELD